MKVLPATLLLLLIAPHPVDASDMFLKDEEPVFAEIQPDLSLVYFDVVGGPKSKKPYEVYIDEPPIGFVPEGCYAYTSVEPGLRHVWGSGFSEWFVVGPGRTYLLRADRGAEHWFLDDPGRIRELVDEFHLSPVTATEYGLSALESGLESYSKFRKERMSKHEKVAQKMGRPSDETLPVTIKLAMTYKEKLGEKKMPGFAPRCKLKVTEEIVSCQSSRTQLQIPAEDILQVSFGGPGGKLLGGSAGCAWLHIRYKGPDAPRDAYLSSPLGEELPNDYNLKFAAISDAMELSRR